MTRAKAKAASKAKPASKAKARVASPLTAPILFAARREDGEAGGTELGPWHAASVALFRDRVVPALAPLAKAKLAADDLRRAPISIALAYAGEASVPRAVRKLGERA